MYDVHAHIRVLHTTSNYDDAANNFLGETEAFPWMMSYSLTPPGKIFVKVSFR